MPGLPGWERRNYTFSGKDCTDKAFSFGIDRVEKLLDTQIIQDSLFR